MQTEEMQRSKVRVYGPRQQKIVASFVGTGLFHPRIDFLDIELRFNALDGLLTSEYIDLACEDYSLACDLRFLYFLPHIIFWPGIVIALSGL